MDLTKEAILKWSLFYKKRDQIMIVQSIREILVKNILKLREEINAYQNEEKLWYKEKNIANPAGNLCLHLVGNLNTYIGVALGTSNYVRNRDMEFSQTGLPKSELLHRIDSTLEVVKVTLQDFPDTKLEEVFPVKVFERETTIAYMLVHLTSHLTYHLGQINYHRRLLDTN
jgi:uncharacterized damage-inducible protein DinB